MCAASLRLGVPMRAVNNRPQTANHYNRQPSNRLTAITVNRYNRLTVSGYRVY
jgi:hypothetical protein